MSHHRNDCWPCKVCISEEYLKRTHVLQVEHIVVREMVEGDLFLHHRARMVERHLVVEHARV